MEVRPPDLNDPLKTSVSVVTFCGGSMLVSVTYVIKSDHPVVIVMFGCQLLTTRVSEVNMCVDVLV